MCKILYVRNTTLRRKQIQKLLGVLALDSDDGRGYGGLLEGRFYVDKGLSVRLKRIARAVRKNWDNGVLIHFRNATSGSVNKKMCHPMLSTDGKVLVIHNGMFSDAPSWLKVLRILKGGVYEKVRYTDRVYVWNGRYEYAYGYGYSEERSGVSVSDTWIFTELLSFLIDEKGVEETMLLLDELDSSSNYIIQDREGTVWVRIGHYPIQIYWNGLETLIATRGLTVFYELEEILTGEDVLIRIPKGKELEILYGDLVTLKDEIERRESNKYSKYPYTQDESLWRKLYGDEFEYPY